MFDPHLLRKAVPLTFLAFSACGVAPQSAAPDAPTGGSAVARLADGGATSCPNGGNVLKYGIDKNGNGKLDDNEVLGTFDICNGTSGTLTKISNLAPGTQCSEGGVLVQTGSDANNNGTLEDSEATSSTPICGAGGQITTVLGSITIDNDEDIARYANTETVSARVQVNLTGINGTVTLPKLRAVGMDLGISNYGGGIGLFAEEKSAKGHARKAERLRSLHALNQIPTDTVTVSMPALQSVGGEFYFAGSVKVSVPALTTVGDYISCSDLNASFPALVSLGRLNSNCGDTTTIFSRLTFYGDSYNGRGPSFSNTKLTSVGVRAAYGYTYWYAGTLQFDDPTLTDVSMPALTQAGSLDLAGVYSNNANLNLPALATVGTLSLHAEDDSASFMTTPVPVPFAHITLPLLTVKGYAIESTKPMNGGYAGVVAQLQHVGGVLEVQSALGVPAVNAAHLQTAGGISLWKNSNLASAAFPQLATLSPGDPNDALCYGNLNDDLVQCDDNDPNWLSAIASFVVQGNPNLVSVGFGSVSSIAGGLYFQNDPNLTTVSGLSHLAKLGLASYLNATDTVSSLVINNTGLADLSAFASITSAPGTLVITENQHLADITALHLTGSADTCPVISDNAQLPYCQAVNFSAAYNAACTMSGSAAQLNLKDPCATNTCSGATPNCAPDCNPGSTTGYTCQP